MCDREHHELGLLGLGQFGAFAARHLAPHFEIVATDRRPLEGRARSVGARWGSLDDVAACPLVVLAVPLQAFETALEELAPRLSSGAVVVDVGSVKVRPARLMERLLPREAEIVGTHPMFGPQSAADGIEGHRIVVCPLRVERPEAIESFLSGELGLEVIVTDPESHDRAVARTQGLAQFIGRALARLDEGDPRIRTPAYDQLRAVAETVGSDTWELFSAIQNLNPHGAAARRELRDALESLDRRLADDLEALELQLGDERDR